MFGRAASGRPGACICSSAVSAARSPAPWFAPIAATSSPASRSAASRRVTPASVSASSSKVISATIGSEDTLSHGCDRVCQLLEVEERLEHEQVGAAALEQGGLLGEELLPALGARRLPQRPDRAPDEHVTARQLTRLPRQLHRRGVDPLELVLEVVRRELPPVRAEGVRLDQLGAGLDEAHMQRHDRLRGPKIRLLGRPEPRHRRSQKRPHPPIAHDRGALREACLEARSHPRKLDNRG